MPKTGFENSGASARKHYKATWGLMITLWGVLFYFFLSSNNFQIQCLLNNIQALMEICSSLLLCNCPDPVMGAPCPSVYQCGKAEAGNLEAKCPGLQNRDGIYDDRKQIRRERRSGGGKGL